MTFSFIHAADLHLASPFLRLASTDPELASRLAAASREAMEALVTKAIDLQVAFLVIAGDIYDGDWKDTTIGHFFNRQMSRLDRVGIPVYLIKGNHDADSVVLKSVKLPGNVHTFSAAKAHTLRIPELRVALHGRSFAERAVSENLALNYPLADPGWFNIGILHTSCTGHPDHAPYSPCAVADLLQRGYGYWALGHVHTYEVLNTNPPVVFSGNLQGRNIRETGVKGAVLVTVEGEDVVEVSHVSLDRIRWVALEVDVADLVNESDVFTRLRQQLQPIVDDAAGLPLVLRVTLIGVSCLHRVWKAEPERLREEIQAVAAHCASMIFLEGVRVKTSEPIGIAATTGTALATLDLGAMLLPLITSSEVLSEAAEAMELLRSKYPAMSLPDELFGPRALEDLLVQAYDSLLSSELQYEG